MWGSYVGVCGRMWGCVSEPNQVPHGMLQGSYVGVCGSYVGVCGRMWGGVSEPNQVPHGMVQGSYVGVCGAYVGVCGCVCVNQTIIPKIAKSACMWECMWAYVGCMWAYVGVCGCMWDVCGRMWAYVTYAFLKPTP